MQKMKLFCLPYAGGSATIYIMWKRYIGEHIELCPVELSGRGSRFNEPLYDSLEETVLDLSEKLSEQMDGSSYAFFGHSMGALLAYKLAYRMQELGFPCPAALFLSGRYPPGVKKEQRILHTLNTRSFMNEIYKMGGTPLAVMQNAELYDIYSKVIRADIRMLEQYKESVPDYQLNCDFTVLNGTDDPENIRGIMEQWQLLTHGETEYYEFAGHHFFIFDHPAEICEIVNKKLEVKV